ncbi:tyrosine-type recombinase/integrase [Mesorhizobium sp. VK25A]|nr:tyrosine-type recombinase/integrase [Mesorhizobium sp. VK25A]MDX8548611.1 tyrosine-type recombinase/integrase [Mesorhizobium sp. VK25A]
MTRFGIHTAVERYGLKVVAKIPSLATKRVSPHSIRHTTAIHLLRAGVDINTVRGWLGHVSLDTTNVYAEVDFETKAKALEKCEAPSLGKIPKRWRDQPALMLPSVPVTRFVMWRSASSPACRLWPAAADATSLPKPHYAPGSSRE